MARIVLKFGGTSVGDIDRIKNVARKVKVEVDAGHQVAVVVSAMSGVTNKLVEYCAGISPLHDAREYDAVVASGEQVTSGLTALALQELGITARSWQGWQIPIRTDDVHAKARIGAIETEELERRLSQGEVAGDRRLPGHVAERPDHDARPRRLRYLGGGVGRGNQGRPLRHLYGR